jgi:apolipoprotein D and lipocalin family protein
MLLPRNTRNVRLISSVAIGVATAMLVGVCLTGCKSHGAPLAVVPEVELSRYLGTWYEIARYPNRFEKNCVAVTATYSLRDDGRIRVVNAARLHTLDGKSTSVVGRAWVPDPQTPAKLRVSFFGPFAADYWIIGLGEQYDYAVVSEPSRAYLWILSRTPHLEDGRYQAIVQELSAQGFDLTKLEKTLQPSNTTTP